MSEAEQTTLLGFLVGYRGYTRDAYTLDLRQGKARATVARRLCTIGGFYRYAEEEG